MQNGNLVVAQCKFTPFAKDGKEFHCDFSPPVTPTEMSPTASNHFETTGESITSVTPPIDILTTEGSGLEDPPVDAESLTTTDNPGTTGTESLRGSPAEKVFPGDQPAVGSMASPSGDRESGETLCQTLDSRCRKAIAAIGHLVNPSSATTPQHCDPLDEACRTLQGKLLFPPRSPATAVHPPLSADPCDGESDCVSWRFLRMIAAPFLAALKGPEVALDQFSNDDTTLFSVEGARLYRLALSQAPDSQRLDHPYLLRMVYRTQLDSLLQIRFARVEMQSYLSRMLWLSVGLALPSVLLSSIYLLIHLRWAVVNRRERLQAKRASRDQRLLQEYQRGEAAARPIS